MRPAAHSARAHVCFVSIGSRFRSSRGNLSGIAAIAPSWPSLSYAPGRATRARPQTSVRMPCKAKQCIPVARPCYLGKACARHMANVPEPWQRFLDESLAAREARDLVRDPRVLQPAESSLHVRSLLLSADLQRFSAHLQSLAPRPQTLRPRGRMRLASHISGVVIAT